MCGLVASSEGLRSADSPAHEFIFAADCPWRTRLGGRFELLTGPTIVRAGHYRMSCCGRWGTPCAVFLGIQDGRQIFKERTDRLIPIHCAASPLRRRIAPVIKRPVSAAVAGDISHSPALSDIAWLQQAHLHPAGRAPVIAAGSCRRRARRQHSEERGRPRPHAMLIRRTLPQIRGSRCEVRCRKETAEGRKLMPHGPV